MCDHVVCVSFGAGFRPNAKGIIIAMVSSSRREKCRAKFKKGQRCLMPKFTGEGEEEMLVFIEGEILRAEKRTIEVDNAQVASYHYRVLYVDDGRQHDDWKEESELYKFNADLLRGEETLLAEQARQHAWQQYDFRKAQARLEKIPERLRLRIPVALKRCVVKDYERVCVDGNVDGVRPRVRGRGVGVDTEAVNAGMDMDMDVDGDGDVNGEDNVDVDVDVDVDVKTEGDEKDRDDAREARGANGATVAAATTSDGDLHERHGDARTDMSVAAIIKMWRSSMFNKDEIVQDDSLGEGVQIVSEGLLTYFNQGVRQFLLYAPEVPLYDEIFAKKRKRAGDGSGEDELEPADVYGVQHLVRLLVKLPELVCVQMMALPVEGARYIVAVEDWLMELMEFLEAEFFPDGRGGSDKCTPV